MRAYDEWMADIPCQFRGKPNIAAVINAFARQIEDLRDINRQLVELTDIDTASGKNLDMLGDVVNVSRKEAYMLLNRDMTVEITDKMYRNVLRFQALKNNSDANYADIMKGLHLLWGNAKIHYAEAVREPASIEVSIEDITTDETDPALIRPMVIRAGGVKILFRSSYTDKLDTVSWERFGNCFVAYEKHHRWNRAFNWDGAIEWHSEGISFTKHWEGNLCFNGESRWNADGVKYHYFNDSYKFGGAINWMAFTEKEDISLMGDAVLLNQAKRKMLRLRFDGNGGFKIAKFVFGTGLGDDGRPYEPDAGQTELRNEILRKDLDSKSRINNSCYRYSGMLSEIECNGQHISEIGLADSDGMLICVKTFDRKLKNLEAEMTFRIDDMF